MAQTGTLIKCTDGLEPEYASIYSDGQRPANAADFLLSGSSLHGQSASISTVGSVWSFGDQAPLRHAELGGTFRHLGQSQSNTTAWGSNQGSIITNQLRAANVGYQYKFSGFKVLGTSLNDSAISPANTKMYFSYWSKYNIDFLKTYVCVTSSITGTFTQGADRGRGETVTVLLSDATTAFAYACYQSGEYLTLDFGHPSNTQTINISKLNGATITGQSSSATATLNTSSDHLSLLGTKYSRAMHGLTSSGARMWIIPVGTQGFDTDAWYANGDPYPNFNPTGGGSIPLQADAWQFIEHVYDAANGDYDVFCNGQLVITYRNLPEREVGGPVGLRPTLLGFDHPGGPIPSDSRGGTMWQDSINYNTGSYARIILTDNANYSLSTKFEVQPFTDWERTGVNFVVNRGAVTEEGFLHVWGIDGQKLTVIGGF